MSYKLQITDQTNGHNFNVRYENMSKQKKLEIEAKTPNGTIAKERTWYQGKALMPGDTQRRWVDDKGMEFSKNELKFYYNGQEVSEIEQTKVFDIQGYQPMQNYTDKYIIGAYYELSPDDNGMKKDFDRERAKQANLSGMHKLWKYLYDNQVVARGEFCTSSRGFIASDGYIRAIKIDNSKWGLEIGVFKEEKIFQHLQEGTPTEIQAQMPQATKAKRIKVV
jgi:hypothetical protein